MSGPYRYYAILGYKKEEGTLMDGEKHGLCTRFNIFGHTEEESMYHRGHRHGSYVRFSIFGYKKEKGMYEYGKRCGIWSSQFFGITTVKDYSISS